ncbi:hypothetical protein Tco_0637064 [Tanacetum coccineum]
MRARWYSVWRCGEFSGARGCCTVGTGGFQGNLVVAGEVNILRGLLKRGQESGREGERGWNTHHIFRWLQFRAVYGEQDQEHFRGEPLLTLQHLTGFGWR